MARTLAILTLAVTGIASTYAGSVGINAGNQLNPDGSVSVGLLPTNVTNTDVNGFTGTKTFGARNYLTTNTVLGAGSIITTLPAVGTTCTSACQQTVYNPPISPEFNLLGDNKVADDGLNSNFWLSASSGTGTNGAEITIPIGIFGVTTVATLLNTAGGVTTGGTVDGHVNDYAQIIFAFNATNPAGGAGTVYETLDLINGVTQRNIVSGWCQSTCTNAYATTLSSSYSVTDANTSAAYTVTTGNFWNGKVSTAGGTTGVNTAPPVNTVMNLDYQLFPIFAEFQNDYLVSVSISNTGTNNGATSATYSQEILSGITLDLGAVPEPSTIVMLLSGLGLIGFTVVRRKRA